MRAPLHAVGRFLAPGLVTGLALACCGALAADLPADVQLLRTRSLAATCIACHASTDRASSTPSATTPTAFAEPSNLAGMPATRISAAMQAFKNGSRSGTVMPQLARGFSVAQIDQLAHWFAAATPDAR